MTQSNEDSRYILLHLIDEVMEASIHPLESKIKELCQEKGHEFIDDQCGKPEHKYCVFCQEKIGLN